MQKSPKANRRVVIPRWPTATARPASDCRAELRRRAALEERERSRPRLGAASRLRVAPPSPLRYDAIAPKPEAAAEKRRAGATASGAAWVGGNGRRPRRPERQRGPATNGARSPSESQPADSWRGRSLGATRRATGQGDKSNR